MDQHQRLLDKYFVPPMGLYTEPGGEVSAILRKLECDIRLCPAECQFLRDKGLHGLSAYAKHFAETGNRDRRLLRTPDDRRRDARQRNRALREAYEIDFIEENDYPTVMAILRRVDEGSRLTDDDVIQLKAAGCFTHAMKRVFHRNEAKHHHRLFDENRDPHNAISANSHYRKAGESASGLQLLANVDFDRQRDSKLKSALYTTKGGSLRDLRNHETAMQCAEQGHVHDPASFHPCTLLGALHYEAGNRTIGDEWFAKAIEHGAKADVIDMELRTIWKRSSPEQRSQMRHHLLSTDPDRYQWINETSSKARSTRTR